MLSPRVERALVALLVLLFALLAAAGGLRRSATIDEYAHLAAGCAALRLGTFDLYAKNPPLVRHALAAPALALGAEVPRPQMPTLGAGWDPWSYGDRFVEANAPAGGLGRYRRLLTAARLVGIGLGVGLLLLLHAWARRVHGPGGALLTLFLAALSPTLLAHTSLATVDVGSTLLLVLAVWLTWRALLRPGTMRWALAGAGLGAALAAKFTALLLLPLIGLWALWLARGQPRDLRRTAWRAAAFGLAALFVVQAAYHFDRPLGTLGSFPFASGIGRGVARILPAWTPVPLPAAMVMGIDGQSLDLEQAEMPNYLNGRWSRSGWLHYYPEALLLKTPLALWGLGLLAAGLALRRRKEAAGAGAVKARWVAVSVVLTVLGAAMTSHLNIGVRYLLPMLPFLYLLLGGLAAGALDAGRWARAVAGVLLVAYGGATLSAYPDYLTFFNSLAGGPRGGWRYLANSNNDWGQDLPRLAEWLEENAAGEVVRLAYFGHMDPERYGINYVMASDQPVAGVHAVSLNLLLGMPYVVVDHGEWRLIGQDLTTPQNRFAWLREREPVAKLGGTIWVYRVE